MSKDNFGNEWTGVGNYITGVEFENCYFAKILVTIIMVYCYSRILSMLNAHHQNEWALKHPVSWC
jgi:hypothetical protein